MDISIIGAGYVGLVTGVGLAKLGHNVTCVDIDEEKVEKINQGISPIEERELDNLLREVLRKKVFRACIDIKEVIKNSEITFVCVGTPCSKDGRIDLTQIKKASIDLGKSMKNIKKIQNIVIKSTVIPTTTEKVIIPIIEKYSEKKIKKDFRIAVNPEFLREGSAVHDFFNPSRIIIGSLDKKIENILLQLYKDFNVPIIKTDLKTAEMIKYVSNVFLATKISFINEIGNICKILGIDTDLVSKAAGLDPRISSKYLKSGIGFGGSCLPKDLKALINFSKYELGYQPHLLEAVLKVNEEQPLKFLKLVEKKVKDLKNLKIGILGLTFKPNTDDVRDAPSIKIIKYLKEKGAEIYAYDPSGAKNMKKLFEDIYYCNTASEVSGNCDVILILTEWNEFKDTNLYIDKIVFDGRGIEEAKVAKFYEGVCW